MIPTCSSHESDGILIVNADDWGRDRKTTDSIIDCVKAGAVSSVSAMVFMSDSERAADIALERGIDAGLHLNFTTPFTSRVCPERLHDHHSRLRAYLRGSRLNQIMFHPALAKSFGYVVSAQIAEYRRLYGSEPRRLDGHHHMHLCANVLLARLLPAGTMVRRNFSFRQGEKSVWNRTYRRYVDHLLNKRHRLVDFLFTLPPLEPRERLQTIGGLAKRSVVELETHPVDRDEYRFLTSGEIFRHIDNARISAHRA